MRLALLADIHGNADALAAVLDAARAEGVEHLLVVGDLVGYYHTPARVLDLLSDWRRDVVRGNHEELLARWRRGEDHERLRAKYGSGLAAACEQLDDATLVGLETLPHPLVLPDLGVCLCHGTPTELDRYVYPDAAPAAAAALVQGCDTPLVVCGHTHYPASWILNGRRVVNPGSVGQPRDRRPGACWALWDRDADTVALRREAYDPAAVIAEARRRDPDVPYLVEVLTRTS